MLKFRKLIDFLKILFISKKKKEAFFMYQSHKNSEKLNDLYRDDIGS